MFKLYVRIFIKFFSEGQEYRTIHRHRSAILPYHLKVEVIPTGKHPKVCQLSSWVFNERTPQQHIL